MAITFKKVCVHEGLHQWDILIDGEPLGEMEKERPSKWHGNGVSGMVRDRQAPWMWCAWVILDDGNIDIEIPDGSTAWEARRLIKAALL